jgi:hypothetical protein
LLLTVRICRTLWRMATLPSPGDVLKLTLFHQGATVSPIPMRSSWYLSYSGSAPTSTNLNSLATALAAQWITDLKGNMVSDLALTEIFITDLSSLSGATGQWLGAETGSLGSFPLAQGPVHVQWKLSRRYRGGKPGWYLPALSTTDTTNGFTWNTTDAGNVASASGLYVNSQNGVAYGAMTIGQHVSVSYYEGFTVVTNPTTGRARNKPTPRSAPLVDIVQAYAADSRISSQRRRRGKSEGQVA